jgi:hypothetical protein
VARWKTVDAVRASYRPPNNRQCHQLKTGLTNLAAIWESAKFQNAV